MQIAKAAAVVVIAPSGTLVASTVGGGGPGEFRAVAKEPSSRCLPPDVGGNLLRAGQLRPGGKAQGIGIAARQSGYARAMADSAADLRQVGSTGPPRHQRARRG